MGKQNVKRIVERCQQGDREAFGLLYTAMYDRLRSVCRRYVSDESTIDDLLHDSFLLIFSKIDSLRDVTKAEAWMQKVTQNLSLMYLEHHKQQPVVSLDELNEPLVEATPATMPVSYDEIMNLVDALPESYQRVFRLSVLEGLSHQEIAALLNIEPHTSSAQLVRAKKKLRQSLTFFLLGLLCICLPLAWYWLDGQGTANESEKVASKAKKDGTQIQKNDILPISPSRANSESVVCEPRVRPVRTRMEVPLLSDSLSSLTANHTESIVTVSEQQMEKEEQKAITESPIEHDDRLITGQNRTTRQYTPDIRHQWSVQLAYSGLNGQQSFNLPYGEYGMNDPELDTITHHHMPLTIALSVNKMLSNRLSLGTGLQYTQLYSETQAGNTYAWEQQQQRVRYLGIPLRLSWHPVRTRHWSIYGTAQTVLELPLRSTLQKSTYVNGLQVESEKLRLSPSVQWSVGIGAGLEYRLTPVIGIFAEPSLQYFFKAGDGFDTWRTVHPATLSIPIGIRITWE